MAQRTLQSGCSFFSVDNGAMNVPRYWQLRYDACSAVETSANTPRFPYPYRAMNFMAALAMILIVNSCTKWRLIVKGSPRMRDGPIFLKISVPRTLKTTFWLTPISARYPSQDSTFKVTFRSTFKRLSNEFKPFSNVFRKASEWFSYDFQITFTLI